MVPSPRPTSSVYSDDTSIMTSLIRQVSEQIRTQEIRTITCYMKENQEIKKHLAFYRQGWNGTIMLANEAIKVIKTMEKSFITVDKNMAHANKDWLAFWGIYEEFPGSHPAWI